MKVFVFCAIFCCFVGCSSTSIADDCVEAEQNFAVHNVTWLGGHKVRICKMSNSNIDQQSDQKSRTAKRSHGKFIHHK